MTQHDRLAWWEDIPLGLALLAQSYVVGLWYYASVNGAAWWLDLAVAIGAGLALDLIVVTTVMGRRQGRTSGWSWATSFGAFCCSSLIALDRYGWEWRSLLHVAFPLVVFLYSQHLATPRKVATHPAAQTTSEPAQTTRQVAPKPAPAAPVLAVDTSDPLREKKDLAIRLRGEGISWKIIADTVGRSPSTVRDWLAAPTTNGTKEH
jgi:hypothetical protein